MPENSEEKDIFQAAQTAPDTSAPQADYGEETIRTLDWKEHIRLRPGMYIGKLGDGTDSDDGIYVLLKEVLDNAIDEFMMGYGRQHRVGARLRARRAPGQNRRCGLAHEHRRQI